MWNHTIEEYFHRKKFKNDGLNSNCKVCGKQYYKENLVKIKKWYSDNRDRIKEY